MPVAEISDRIFLDYHATSPVDHRVAAVVMHHMVAAFGNPSSADHCFGDEAQHAVEEASRRVGSLVGASPEDVVFTSGATESINLVLQGLALGHFAGRRVRIAVSSTEHSAVLDTCTALARLGRADVRLLNVDHAGRVSLEEIESVCGSGVDLLCVMAANNEVGTIAPVARIGEIASRHRALFLCDATQACGRIPLDMVRDGITFLVLSAHKIHGPKGAGALVTHARRLLAPLLHGGEQQRGLRAGTLNVPGIAGLGEACRLRADEMEVDEAAIARRRDRLQALLTSAIPDLVVNGEQRARLAGNLHVSFPGCPNGAIIVRVRDRLAVATGAACSSGIEAPSHVLRAMGLREEVQDGAIRIGVGKWTTDDEVSMAAEILTAAWRSTTSRLASASMPVRC
jgi:cysteine desulfurase